MTTGRRQRIVATAMALCLVVLAACGGGGGSSSGGGGGASGGGDVAAPDGAVASAMQPQLNGFAFPNFPSATFPDLNFDTADLVSMFGSGPEVCVDGVAEPCTLTAEAAAWARMVNQARATGHCEGLVALASARFNRAELPETVKLPSEEEEIRAVMRAFATQFVPEVQQAITKWTKASLADKVDELKRSFASDKLEYTLGVYVESGGHAVLPYAVEYPTPDIARIMVYDSNWPGRNRYVDVDLKADKWTFSFAGDDPVNDPNLWTGGAGDMDLTPFEAREGTCPFCGDDTKVQSTTMLVRTDNLDWSVQTPGGTVSPTESSSSDGTAARPVKGSVVITRLSPRATERSSYDFMITIPNDVLENGSSTPSAAPGKVDLPASRLDAFVSDGQAPKAGETTTTIPSTSTTAPASAGSRAKLLFGGAASVFAVTPGGVAQFSTPGSKDKPVEVGARSIKSNDPNVDLTLAAGNLVANASGPTAELGASEEGTLAVQVTTATGEVIQQQVTPEAPAVQIKADETGGVTVLEATATGEVQKTEIAADGTKTETVVDASALNLNKVEVELPPALASKPIEALPKLEERNLNNPNYKADVAYVAPTTAVPSAAGAKEVASGPTTTVAKGDTPSTVQTRNAALPGSAPTTAAAGRTSATPTTTASRSVTAAVATPTTVVAVAKPTLSGFRIATKTYGDDSFTLDPPNSNSPGGFRYSSSKTDVAAVNATTGRVTIVGAGSTVITATQAAARGFEAGTITATLIVAKATPQNSALKDITKTFGDESFTIARPTTDSTGAFTFTSSNEDVIRLSRTTGRWVVAGAGRATITVSQASTDDFLSSTDSFVVTVRKGTPELKAPADVSKAFLDADFDLPRPTSDSRGAFTYSSSDANIISVAGNKASIKSAGTVTITAAQAGNDDWLAASTTYKIVVAPAAPILSAFADVSKTFGDDSFTLAAPKSNSTGAITYKSSDDKVVTVGENDGKVMIVGAGSATITASQAATSGFSTGSISSKITVAKATPTISDLLIPDKAFGDADFTLRPTSSSRGKFTFSTDKPTIFAVDADTGLVTIIGVGSGTLTATQATTSNYEAAAVSASVTVRKGRPNIEWVLEGKVFGEGPFDVAIPTSPSSGSFTYAIAASDQARATITEAGRVTLRGAGTVTITASQEATDLYVAASKTATLSIDKATPTLTEFTIPTKVYGDPQFELVPPTSPSSGSFTYEAMDAESTVATVTPEGVVTILGAGTIQIKAKQVSTPNYTAASTVATLTVNKAVQVARVNGGLVAKWSFDSATTLGSNSVGTGDLVQTGGPTWSASGQVGGALSLNGSAYLKLAQGATIAGLPVGNSTYSQSAWFKASALGARGIIGWGNYGIGNQVNALRLFGASGGFRHYWWGNDLDSGVTLQTGQWYHVATTFDGTTRKIYLNGQVLVSDQPTGHNAAANAFAVGATNNFSERFIGLLDEVAIYNRALSQYEVSQLAAGGGVAVSSTSGNYGSPLSLVTSGGQGTGAVTFDLIDAGSAGCVLSGATLTATSGGTCIVRASKGGDSNYEPSESSETVVTFNRIAQVSAVTVTTTSATAGVGLPLIAVGGSGTGAYSFAVVTTGTTGCSIQNNTLVTSASGTCVVTATKAGDTNYVASTSSVASIVVTKQAPTIAPFVLSDRYYLGAGFTVAAPGSNSSGAWTWASSDTSIASINSSTGAVTLGVPGTAIITATQGSTAMYSPAAVTAELTVLPTAPTIGSLTLPAKAYGDSPFTFAEPTSNSNGSITYTSSDPTVATVNSATRTITVVGVGTTTITASQAATSNFTSGVVATELSVVRGVPIVGSFTLSDRYYLGANFTVAAPSSTSAGVWSFASSNSSVASINSSTGAVTLGVPGTAIITATQGSTAMYSPAAVTAELTVLPTAPTIGSLTLPAKAYGDSPFTFAEPTSNSNGSITYTSSDPTVATVNSATRTITIVGVGTTTITASQAATSNFTSGVVATELSVVRGVPIVGSFTLSDRYYLGANFTVAAPSSTSAGVWSFASSNSSVASINSSTGAVTLGVPGTAIITATQGSTAMYNSASVTAQLRVLPANPTFGAFVLSSKTFGDPAFTFVEPTSNSNGSITYTSSDPTVATVNSATRTITVVGVGTTTITASQAATSNFTAGSTTAAFVVNGVTPTLTSFGSDSGSGPGLKGTRYVGYFNDNVNWFATAPKHGQTNQITDFSYFTSNADQYSWEWTGAFKASTSGSYYFCTNSDDASYLWLGPNAKTGFTTGNALVNNGGAHGMTERCGSMTLVGGTLYPIRIQFGEAGGGDAIIVRFTPPGGSVTYNGVGYYFAGTGITKAEGDAPFTPTLPTSNSPGAITYSSSNPDVATINATTGEVTVVGRGVATLTATQAATGTWGSASTTVEMRVLRRATVGSFSIPSSLTFTSAPFTPTPPTSDSPGAWTYESSNTAVARWNSSTGRISVASAGTATITAVQAETGEFAESRISTTLTIEGESLVSIDSGERHTCSLTTNGGVACWGWNAYGQLGDNSYTNREYPVGVTGISSGAVKVATGLWHTCAVMTDGTVKCWGRNEWGQLGNNTRTTSAVPVTVQGITTAVEIAASGYASCAVLSGGGVTCWGFGGHGELGRGTTADSNVPVPVPSLTSGVANIDGSQYHYCVAMVDGSAKCWGHNAWGNLGDGTTTQRNAPVDVLGLTSGAVRVAASTHSSCAVVGGGSVMCWGYGANGQNGNGTTNQTYTAVPVTGMSNAIDVVGGHQHFCARLASGVEQCWGWNGYGQLGTGNASNSAVPITVSGLPADVREISAGYYSSCAITAQGSVWCWGYNAENQLGDKSTTTSYVPVGVAGVKAPVIALPETQLSAVTLSASRFRLGDTGISFNAATTNRPNEVSYISTNPAVATIDPTTRAVTIVGPGTAYVKASVPATSTQSAMWTYARIKVPDTEYVQVSANYYSSCGLTRAGGVKCWGNGDWGQLGNGTSERRYAPTDVTDLSTGVAAVATGHHHACALTTGGGVMCWGLNDNGQIGFGTTSIRPFVPVGVTGLSAGVVQIDAGYQHTCALTSTGGVKCWGLNNYGQLGDGTTENRTTPVDVVGLTSGVAQIDLGHEFTCARLDNGTAKCWGRNDWGNLGDGTTTTRLVPRTVTGLSGATSIAAGFYHSCATLSAGTVRCWGYNGFGQVGDNTTADRATPTAVSGIASGATLVVAGGHHTCVLTSAGGVKCWGRNDNGELGDGTTTRRFVPVDVSGLTAGAFELSASNGYSTCAIVANDAVECWGYNDWGQVGNLSSGNVLVPTEVDGSFATTARATDALGELALPGSGYTTSSPSFTLTAPTTNRAVSTLSCAAGGVCKVGDIGPGGGRVFFVSSGFAAPGTSCSSNCRYLEAAPMTWAGGNDDPRVSWSGNTNTAIGSAARGTAVGTGFGNTTAMVAQSATTNRAATLARAYNGGGLSDWYLPSVDELRQLVLKRDTVGSLSCGEWYQASTEFDAGSRWLQHPCQDSTAITGKGDSRYVRPVRAFAPIDSNEPLTYSSSDPSVATVDRWTGSVTITGAGTTILAAVRGGSGSAKPATSRVTLSVVTSCADGGLCPPGQPASIGGSLSDCQRGIVCSIGDTGPGGGTIFFVDTNDDLVGVDYLEVAATESSANWCNTAFASTELSGSADNSQGIANMQSILSSCTSGAAVVSRNFAGGAKTDWYLPAPAELSLVKSNLVDAGLLTGLSGDYWTSRQHDATRAYTVDPVSGAQTYALKTDTRMVRPIRAFSGKGSVSIGAAMTGFALPASSYVFGTAPFATTAPSSLNPGIVAYTSSNTAVATIDQYSGRVTIVGAGFTTFTASKAAYGSYAARTQTASFTVTKATPTFTGFAPPGGPYRADDPDFGMTPPTVSTNDAGTISYSSNNTSVAAIDATTGVVDLVAAGVAVLTATASGSANWNSASTTFTLNVGALCKDGGVCRVGDLGPGGGTVFLVDSNNEYPTLDFMEIAPADASSSAIWCPNAASNPTTGNAIGDGTTNMTAILAANNACAAAAAADGYSTSTQTDWHLPSRSELQAAVTNLAVKGISLPSGTYWTSSGATSAPRTRTAFENFVSGPTAQSSTNTWQYVEVPVDRASATLLSDWQTSGNEVIGGQPQWDNNRVSGNYPFVQNISIPPAGSAMTGAGMLIHPDDSGLGVGVVWKNTTGSSVSVDISAGLKLAYPLNNTDGIDYWVQRGLVGDTNYSLLGSGSIMSGDTGTATTTASSVTLAAGESVYVVVGRRGIYHWDHTILDFAVTRSTPRAIAVDASGSATSVFTTDSLKVRAVRAWQRRESCKDIKETTGTNTNGVYTINVNNAGVVTPTQAYCLMDSAIDGGGWTLIMKAAQNSTTFPYSSNYWTTANILNSSSLDLSTSDAKFPTFNTLQGTQMLAIFPDIETTSFGATERGSIDGHNYGWTWRTNIPSGPKTALSIFQGPDEQFVQDAVTFDGYRSTIWSSQTDIRFYGFNWNDNRRARWGFGWNENGGGLWPNGYKGSDDTSGGIGLSDNNWSAGDVLGCCQSSNGLNRSMAVQVFIK